jgi:two-component system sensor histidine kinase KdpD
LPAMELSPGRRSDRLLGYLWGIAAPAICTLADWPLRHMLGTASILMTYLLGIFLVASRYGRGASITASLLSIPVFAFFFGPPTFSFVISDLENIVGLGVMIVVANVTSNLLERARQQAEIARQRENHANALYRLSQALSDAQNSQAVAGIAVQHIHEDFAASAVLLFPDANNRLHYPGGKPLRHSLRGADLVTAQRAFEQRSVERHSNQNLPVYFPLEYSQTMLGVLAIQFANLPALSNPELTTFLDTFRNLIAQTLERLRLTEQANIASLKAETEALRNELLSAISHDLRTPLTRIIGASTALIDNNARFSEEEKLDFNKVILEEAQRTSELTSKILDMARLSTGEIILHQEWNTIEEIVGSALNRMEKNLGTRPVRTLLPDNLPLLWVDAVLIEQVLANLIENAIKYTPAGSPIDISAELLPTTVKITVSDYGLGIAKGMEEKIFDKFYRLESETQQNGVGVGLTLCRTIIETHGGTIHATNRAGQGASFIIHLPRHEPPPIDWPEGIEE